MTLETRCLCVYERERKKERDLTSLALRLPSSPSCSESLLDSLPPLWEVGFAACPLGRIQISTRAPSSPLPFPLTAGPLEPPSCSCLLLRSSCSAYKSKVWKLEALALSQCNHKIKVILTSYANKVIYNNKVKDRSVCLTLRLASSNRLIRLSFAVRMGLEAAKLRM